MNSDNIDFSELENLIKWAENHDGGKIEIEELMTDEFIQKYSKFKSFAEMIEEAGKEYWNNLKL